jgi:hypothetical protein
MTERTTVRFAPLGICQKLATVPFLFMPFSAILFLLAAKISALSP